MDLTDEATVKANASIIERLLHVADDRSALHAGDARSFVIEAEDDPEVAARAEKVEEEIMRRLLMLLFVFIASAQLFAQTAEKTVPFTVVLKKVAVPDAPKLQGFAFCMRRRQVARAAGRHAGCMRSIGRRRRIPSTTSRRGVQRPCFRHRSGRKKVWSAPLTGLRQDRRAPHRHQFAVRAERRLALHRRRLRLRSRHREGWTTFDV